ncbi:MAG: hypothetical protein QXL96_11555 [Ignisphaera sp.]
MSSILSKEEELQILKTLEEDIELRYAIVGVLGVLEIFRKIDAIEMKLEEHSKILQEHSRILQEYSK